MKNIYKDKAISSKSFKRGPTQSICLSEIMTILVMYQILQYRNFKSFYNDFLFEYWREFFPNLPSYTRFVELIPQALVGLSNFVSLNRGKTLIFTMLMRQNYQCVITYERKDIKYSMV
ncbi:putative transposase [Francisella tularensis subsp. novicida]|nr:putative transposase [Francisella tularensis subsp. novicida]